MAETFVASNFTEVRDEILPKLYDRHILEPKTEYDLELEVDIENYDFSVMHGIYRIFEDEKLDKELFTRFVDNWVETHLINIYDSAVNGPAAGSKIRFYFSIMKDHQETPVAEIEIRYDCNADWFFVNILEQDALWD